MLKEIKKFNPYKYLWLMRALIYKILFNNVEMPSYIGKPLYINRIKNIILKSKVRIYPGLRVELTTPDAKITFNKNISVGQNLHIVSNGSLTIESDVTISANVFIADVENTYSEIDKFILDQELICKETIIRKNVFIGYGSVILPGTLLGKNCIIGANSVVRGTFPEYSVIAGNPAKIIKKYSFKTNQWVKV